VKNGSARKVKRFQCKFQNVIIPHRRKNSRQIGSLPSKRSESKHQVLTEEKLDETSAMLEQSPEESLRHLAQETVVSKSSTQTATKLLKLESFKTTLRACNAT
jgi:hypothetical protein